MIDIMDFIPHGKRNAIPSRDLQALLHVDKRDLQRIIRNARLKGAVICGKIDGHKGGYFIPDSIEEAIEYICIEKKSIQSQKEALKPVEEYIKRGGCDNGTI